MAEARLFGIQGSLKGRRLPLGNEPISFGRSDENDVVLSGEVASRVHAELRHEDGVYVLKDRGSSNGTWVNGTRVTVHQLQPGDETSTKRKTGVDGRRRAGRPGIAGV